MDPKKQRTLTRVFAETTPDQSTILVGRVTFKILVHLGEKYGIIAFQREFRTNPVKISSLSVGKGLTDNLIRLIYKKFVLPQMESFQSKGKEPLYFGEAFSTPYIVCDSCDKRDQFLEQVYALIDPIIYKNEKKKFDPKGFGKLLQKGTLEPKDKEQISQLKTLLQKNELGLTCETIMEIIEKNVVDHINHLSWLINQKVTGLFLMKSYTGGNTYIERNKALGTELTNLKKSLSNRATKNVAENEELEIRKFQLRDNAVFLLTFAEDFANAKREVHRGLKRTLFLSMIAKGLMSEARIKEFVKVAKTNKDIYGNNHVGLAKVFIKGVRNDNEAVNALIGPDSSTAEERLRVVEKSWPQNYSVTLHHIAKIPPTTQAVLADPENVYVPPRMTTKQAFGVSRLALGMGF